MSSAGDEINGLKHKKTVYTREPRPYAGVPTDDYEIRDEKPWQRVPSIFIILVLGLYMLLGYLTQVIEDDMPRVVPEAEVAADSWDRFSEESAQRYLQQIIGDQPRVAGTPYHLQKTRDMYDLVQGIAAQAKLPVLTDWQIATGYRESAFLYALTAAGVAHSVARACAQGRLLSCGCDPLGYRASHDPRRARANKWEWSGCSHNLAYGIEFSRKFLDVREQVDDLQSKIDVHNNNAGRSILSSHMEVRCKCHGLSGSCQLRTCWRATPDFRVVASTIKRQYRKALMVAQEELNSGVSVLRGRPRGRRRSRAKPAPRNSLLFFEKSPSFCEVDPKTDSWGTSGRVCRIGRTSRTGSCDLLCCGRGHALLRKSSIKPCNCTFHWCCRVDCQRCTDEKWIAVCK